MTVATFVDQFIDISNGAQPPALVTARLGGGRYDQVTSNPAPPHLQALAGRFNPSKSRSTGVFDQPLIGLETVPPSGQDLGVNFDSYHYLAMIIYLLSNGHLLEYADQPLFLDQEKDLADVLDITFRLVSIGVLLALLQSRLPSVKAMWEKLVYAAGTLGRKDAFRFLILVGMDQNWLEEQSRGHEHLYHAILNDCQDLIDTLLERGCRADSSVERLPGETAITVALRKENLECAKRLIQSCNVNLEIPCGLGQILSSTAFGIFIEGFDETKVIHHQCLDVFLGRGADVDLKMGEGLFPLLQSEDGLPEDRYGIGWRGWYVEDPFVTSWRPSILDFVFYFRHRLFQKLAPFSKTLEEFSRAGALCALRQGVHSLREYLARDWTFDRSLKRTTGEDLSSASASEWKSRTLEIIFVEQFLLSTCERDRVICWKTVQGLMEVGVDVARSSKDEKLASEMLLTTARFIKSGEGADEEHGMQILQWLLDRGFRVEALALSAAVEDHGVAILECLAAHCFDLRKHGVMALAKAASRNNFDATKLLLDGGVDPNSTFLRELWGEISAFAAAFSSSNFEMMKYMIERGARPTSWKPNCRSLNTLPQILRARGPSHEIFIKVQYIVEELVVITDPSYPSAQLLEACFKAFDEDVEQRRELFELLLSKGARLTPGSPLAAWIAAGGGHHLVQEMLEQGADLDAHSNWESYERNPPPGACCRTPLQAAAGRGDYALVRMLLDRGADVNRPARGSHGMTALHAICAWDPVRPEERIQKDKIIKMLLEEGADVNAANIGGQTALIKVAMLGDLPTAFILMKHGARVNMATTMPCDQTALDMAAYFGRLDMVDFLLNAGARSGSARTGGESYDGAIKTARTRGHFAVAELICKHSADRERDWAVEQNPTGYAMPPACVPPWPVSEGDSRTAHAAQTIGRLTPSIDNGDSVSMMEHNSVSYTPGNGLVESISAGSKAKGKGTARPETTGGSWAHVIEEIDDEQPLADYKCGGYGGEKGDGAADQHDGTWNALLGQKGDMGQPSGEFGDEDQQQDSRALVSSDMRTDVFMGFSRSPIL